MIFQTKALISTTVAHTDFIKALIVIPSLKILVTGSSDKDLRIWDLQPLSTDLYRSSTSDIAETLEQQDIEDVFTAQPDFYDIPVPTGAAPPTAKAFSPLPLLLSLKSHTRPIEKLAYYHITEENKEESVKTKRIILLSADSMGALKSWEIWRDDEGSLRGELRSDIRPHEMGIYDLIVGDGEIWTGKFEDHEFAFLIPPTNLVSNCSFGG